MLTFVNQNNKSNVDIRNQNNKSNVNIYKQTRHPTKCEKRSTDVNIRKPEQHTGYRHP